ncbi:ribonuclease Z [Chitinophaga ginsengisoli]|uniref:Ribonuclease Z n=1 Tax=Chitinophaga ginsengisoli TaxID=363837 RepID=A0A2P8GCN2_9BACT|nr:ribonuclease Z [Chitinophaga ginsengisoli]PSL31729.1 ribonuclease Z [Chitinophaga ginsengisoli]
MFAVTILGNNSALPTLERHPTAQIITCNDQLILVDCGEGTQLQFARYKIKSSRLRYIFISHLHGDHYFGLIGLLNSLNLLGRKEPLTIFAPPELEAIIQLQMQCSGTIFQFELQFVPLLEENQGLILSDKDLNVSFFPTIHRIPCYGFIFEMQKRKRKLLPEQAKVYEIPAAYYSKLQEGADYQRKDGFLVKNDWVTLPPPREKKYVFYADTAYSEELVRFAHNADLVYHETTYLHALAERAAERFHSTTVQAATLALKAHAHRLIVGHFSSKYTDLTCFEEECREIFPNSDVATEGATFII